VRISPENLGRARGGSPSLPRATGHQLVPGGVEGSRITDCALPAFNLFLFYLLRTLAAQRMPATPLLSIACGLFPSQWGCIPLRHSHSPLLPRCAPTGTLLFIFPSCCYGLFLSQRGGYTPSPQKSKTKMKPEPTNPASRRRCQSNNFGGMLKCAFSPLSSQGRDVSRRKKRFFQ
jgi:hypothetical protein